MSERERLYYAENVVGYVYLASQQSNLKPGFMLKSTTNPKEMDRIFARLNQQERDHNEKMLEQLYSRGRQAYENKRDYLRGRLASSGCSPAEKTMIREALRLMDERDRKMQQNTVYGVSGVQEAPEPLPARNTVVMIEDRKVRPN